MQKLVFRGFLAFGVVTVISAFLGGGWALFRRAGAASNALGFLLLFLGASLAVMLASLLYVAKKEKRG